MADEHDGEAVLGVHGVVDEQAQLLEQLGAQLVGLVDDELGSEPVLSAEARDFGAHLLEGRRPVALRGGVSLDEAVGEHADAPRDRTTPALVRDPDGAFVAGLGAVEA